VGHGLFHTVMVTETSIGFPVYLAAGRIHALRIWRNCSADHF